MKNLAIILFLISNVNIYALEDLTEIKDILICGTNQELRNAIINNPKLDLNQSYKENSILNDAIIIGDLEKVEMLITLGADINKEHKGFLSPLKWAILRRKNDIIRFLIDNNVLVDQSDIILANKYNQDALEILHKDCLICFDSKLLIKLSCGHEFCLDCLKNQVDIALREKNTVNLNCSIPNCRKKFEELDIRKIYKNNLDRINLYCDIATNELLAQDSKIKFCPTPDCDYLFEKVDNIKIKTQCPLCHKTYCSDCLLDHKLSLTCEEHAQRIVKKQENFKSEQWIKDNAKKCPNCNVEIYKDKGCLDVCCTKCKVHFWWCCLKLSRNHKRNTHANDCRYKGKLSENEQ